MGRADASADLGADVIKIERPAAGTTPVTGDRRTLKAADGTLTGEAAYFLSANRGAFGDGRFHAAGTAIDRAGRWRRSPTCCSKTSRSADWRYGLDAESLRALNAAAHLSLDQTGFWSDGLYRDLPGYDA